MWALQGLVIAGGVRPAPPSIHVVVATLPPEAQPVVLVQVLGYEWRGRLQHYTAVQCHRLWFVPPQRYVGGDPRHQATDLTAAERQAIRDWLYQRSRRAYRHAAPQVRVLLEGGV